MTAKQISERMGLSKATVVRDMEKLSRAEFAITEAQVANRHVLGHVIGAVSATCDRRRRCCRI